MSEKHRAGAEIEALMIRPEASSSSFLTIPILQPLGCLVDSYRAVIAYADMDPITALGFAGTIVQFVDFGSKLLSASGELYKSTTGSLTVNDEIELVTSDLLAIAQKLRPNGSISPELRKICDRAARLAQELLGRLDKLKVKANDADKSRVKEKGGKIWQSLKQAIATVWSKDERSALVGRLAKLREAIDTHVLLALR
jgi:hypothetical protein